MSTVTVRVTRTWDVPVTAEYGDDDKALIAKAREVLDNDYDDDDPVTESETCNILPNPPKGY